MARISTGHEYKAHFQQKIHFLSSDSHTTIGKANYLSKVKKKIVDPHKVGIDHVACAVQCDSKYVWKKNSWTLFGMIGWFILV